MPASPTGLGAGLRAARLKAGLSGTELAAQLGRSQSWVSRVEHDRTRPTTDEVERWAKATELDAEEAGALARLARAPGPLLPGAERRAVVARIEVLLGMVAEEVQRLR